jgi:hypothetical protein
MKTFNEWLISESINIVHIDPEEDWEEAEQAEAISKLVGIRPDSTKSPTIIALNDKEEVVGAAFTSWSPDYDASEMAGEDVSVWDFDVVVHPNWQGREMIGIKLIKQAEEERKNMESMYGQKAYTRTWVVNPRLAKVMQNRYGYDAESSYKDGSAHLVKH